MSNHPPIEPHLYLNRRNEHLKKKIYKSSIKLMLHDYVLKNRANPTPEERVVRAYINFLSQQEYDKKYFNFHGQYPIKHEHGFYIIDFLELNYRLAFEVDGGYHWKSDQVDYDLRRIDFLRENYGITVVCIPNALTARGKPVRRKLKEKILSVLDGVLTEEERRTVKKFRKALKQKWREDRLAKRRVMVGEVVDA